MTKIDDLDGTFALLEATAIKNERCPQNYPHGPLTTSIITALARAGRIKVEVFARNWRVVTIMDGPHRGKRTKLAPGNAGPPYKVIYKDHIAKHRFRFADAS